MCYELYRHSCIYTSTSARHRQNTHRSSTRLGLRHTPAHQDTYSSWSHLLTRGVYRREPHTSTSTIWSGIPVASTITTTTAATTTTTHASTMDKLRSGASRLTSMFKRGDDGLRSVLTKRNITSGKRSRDPFLDGPTLEEVRLFASASCSGLWPLLELAVSWWRKGLIAFSTDSPFPSSASLTSLAHSHICQMLS